MLAPFVTRIACLAILGVTWSSISIVRATEPGQCEAKRVQEEIRRQYDVLYGNPDAEAVLSITHAKVIELLGGRDKARQAISQALKTTSSIKLEKLSFPAEPTFLKGTENEFVIVPTVAIVIANGKKGESQNFQFGARRIGEDSWKYIEGSRLNRNNISKFFPDFPEDFKFPHTSRKLLTD